MMASTDVSPYMNKSSRDAFGLALIELAAQDDRIVAITADVPDSVRMTEFRQRWPERFFDFGIAEQNMMAAAAGFARCGKIPFVSLYAIFASLRAAEQARTDIAYANLPVRICASHSGISLGQGGPTHHAVEDIAYYRTLANMTVIAPADGIATAAALFALSDLPGPVYLRMSRAAEPTVYTQMFDFTIGKARRVRDGSDISLLAYGGSVGRSLQAAEILAGAGIEARVIDMASVKPLDVQVILNAAETGAILTIEEHTIIGGLGSAVAEVLAEAGLLVPRVRFRRLGIPDVFTLAGPYPDLLAHYALDAQGIARTARELLG